MKNPVKYIFSKESKGEGYVPNNQLMAYSSGLAGQNLTYFYVANWLRYFCINILHIDEMKVGTVFSASYVWDAINDPIAGAFVDKRRYKPYKKLRPFLLYLPPIIGILSALMFLDVNFSEGGKIAYILVMYFAWDFFYSFQDVGLWGMIALSSPHSEERSRVAQWVSIGAGAGSAIVGAFQVIRTLMQNSGMSDITIFMIVGIIFGLGGELISMNAYRMEERVLAEAPKNENVFQSLAIIRHNPKLLLISLARFVLGLSPKVQNAYFFENSVTFMNGQTAETLFGLIGGIPGAGAMFFANKIAEKIGGMKKILILSQLTAIGIRIVTYFVGFNSLPRFIIMTLLISLVNLPGSLMDIANRSLISDSIDEMELKTGLRTEGVSFSMQNFTTKITSGATTVIESVLLKTLGYDRFAKLEGRTQSEHFIKWQWPMFMLGPVVGAVIYLIVVSFIKDSKEQKAETERLLKARRAELEKENVKVNSPAE